ncbi:MAG: DUF4215 domain-containing protein, partial [Deltaproteobacteria bacterium]
MRAPHAVGDRQAKMGSTLPKLRTSHRLAAFVVVIGMLAGARPGESSVFQQQHLAVCGDSIVDAGEDCDDGNTVSGDGCTALCGLEVTSNGCIGPVTGLDNCVANDTGFVAFEVLNLIDGCTDPNDTFTVELRGDVRTNAQARYDIGLWINLDGTDAISGATCHRQILVPISADPNDFPDPNNIIGLYRDLENTPTIDICGDIEDSPTPEKNFVDLPALTFPCIDTNGNGFADISGCASWGQAKRTIDCRSVLDAIPGTASKCRCDTFSLIDIPVPSCGNGIVDPGEQCDDGNNIDADGCEADCTNPFCGNGI